jgi:sialidase-1
MKKILFFSLVFIISFAGYAWNSPPSSAGTDISVSVHCPISPVLKGIQYNPLIRIAVYVPAGKAVTYKNIHCSVNTDAVKKIDKLQLFSTGSEPLFANTEIIASPAPASSFDVPVNIFFQPGWHYLWFSATLKPGADIDGSVDLYCECLTDASDKSYNLDKPSQKKRIGVAIRKGGDDNVNTYRIPGITTTDKGTLIAVYDIRYNNSRDLPENIDVGMSRSTDGGTTWQPMKIIMDMGAPHENNGIGDPSILFDPVTKKIWVASLWSKGNRSIAGSGPGLSPDETGQFVLVNSGDDGLTWSEPINITTQVKNPAWRLFFQGPGNGITMKNGTLVFPAQYWDAAKVPHSTIIYSSDHGITWKSGIGAKSNTTESQVVETTPGVLMLNMRDNRGNFRSVSTTTDMGQTWLEHFTSYNTLRDPVCMAGFNKSTINLKSKPQDIVFFSNCNSSSGRYNITVKASLDLGESWKEKNQILIDERKSDGYSAITKINDNTIGLIYEGIKDLYFVRIPVNEIIK